jgi:hypothetical protein
MKDEERASTLQMFLDMCCRAFPEEVTNETRLLCRKYQSQVVEPLQRLTENIFLSSLIILNERVGWFLYQDGNYNDGKEFLLRTFETSSKVFQKKDLRVLETQSKLLDLCIEEGRYQEAAKLVRDVKDKEKGTIGPFLSAPMTLLLYTTARVGRRSQSN